MPQPKRACLLVELDGSDVPHLIWIDFSRGDYHVGTMRFSDAAAAKRASGLIEAAGAHFAVGADYLREAEQLQASGDRQVFPDRAAALRYFAGESDAVRAWHADALLDAVDPLPRDAG
jgi:hypothetical protein